MLVFVGQGPSYAVILVSEEQEPHEDWIQLGPHGEVKGIKLVHVILLNVGFVLQLAEEKRDYFFVPESELLLDHTVRLLSEALVALCQFGAQRLPVRQSVAEFKGVLSEGGSGLAGILFSDSSALHVE